MSQALLRGVFPNQLCKLNSSVLRVKSNKKKFIFELIVYLDQYLSNRVITNQPQLRFYSNGTFLLIS